MTTQEKVEAILRDADLSRTRLQTVAAQLCMSDSTLRRHLLREGTTYSSLLEAERKRRCGEVLQKHGRRAYGKILAQELGYMELNSFYRAYKHWFGSSFEKARMGA